jgi:proline iminopeptidase
MKKLLSILLIISVLVACQKEQITIGTNVSETFFLKNKGAAMPVNVFGNTASKTIVIYIAGGPGGPGLLYRTPDMEEVEKDYAVAYIDQRNSGISQGTGSKNHNMDLMTEDLDKVIDALKHRYGADCSVFILGHSFGGMAVSAYVTKDNLQNKIKGWIDCDGISDFPSLAKYNRDMMLLFGKKEIAAGRNIPEWQKMVDWCEARPNELSADDANFANANFDPESLMNYDITNINNLSIYKTLIRLNSDYNFAILNYGINFFSTSNLNSEISIDITTRSYTDLFKKVTIPSLFMVGEYDFICPPALHQDAYNNVNTSEKKIIIVPNAGHEVHINNPQFFVKEVKDFVKKYK